MTLTHEVRGSLAKCLAMENLIVEHKNTETAMFDVEKRILTLPNWAKASDTVYQMLILHEVGHSLATPNIDWTLDYPKVPKDVVNVLEDARIERLMKKKYPGSSRTFYVGYNELNAQDFFSVKDEDLSKLSLIDRINLYFKIGAFHNIQFNDVEEEFLTRISLAETFQDVLEISQDLVDYVKEKKKEEIESMPELGNQQSGSGNQQQGDNNQSEEGVGENEEPNDDNENAEDKSGQSQSTPTQSNASGGAKPDEVGGRDGVNELESKTSRSFDEKSKQLNENKYTDDYTAYVELPEFDLSKLVLPNEYVHRLARRYYEQSIHKSYYESQVVFYNEFKKSAEREVSYLIKEFECKKSADAYARSTTARTGILNTSLLHTYKYNEDLFKKVSVIPDGKNHGLIFILDWSGSMADYMLDTYKQLLSLIWFCRKVNIPFEVYAFTQDTNAYLEFDPTHTPTTERKANVLIPESSFRLMNLFTSKVNNQELEKQLKTVWAICTAYQTRYGYVPTHMNLSGTPLGETMIALNQLIPQFISLNKVQKVNVVFLTDGEGRVTPHGVIKKQYNGEEFVTYRHSNETIIRNRKNGRMYPAFSYCSFPDFVKVLMTYTKDMFPNVNLINFRVAPTKELSSCYNWFGDKNVSYETIKEQFRKNKFVSFSNSGFDKFFVLSSTSMSSDADLNVDSGASKTAIKSAFTKMLKNKKTNKKVLSSFVELVA